MAKSRSEGVTNGFGKTKTSRARGNGLDKHQLAFSHTGCGDPGRRVDRMRRRRADRARRPGRPCAGKGRLFGVSFQTMNNPFFVDLKEGLKGVIEAHGDRLVTLDAQFNSLKQKNDISDLLQQQPAAIFINPVNWEGVRGSLIEAKRKNVPVIVVDAPVSDPELVLCQVASRQRRGGPAGGRGAGQGEAEGQGRHPAPLGEQGLHRPRGRLQGGGRQASRRWRSSTPRKARGRPRAAGR